MKDLAPRGRYTTSTCAERTCPELPNKNEFELLLNFNFHKILSFLKYCYAYKKDQDSAFSYQNYATFGNFGLINGGREKNLKSRTTNFLRFKYFCFVFNVIEKKFQDLLIS